jgi:hypothetical protein
MTQRFAPGAASAALLSLLLLCGCARTVATTWGFSSWYRQGAGSLGFGGAFETQRDTCLSQAGISDPAGVAVDSPQETAFIECMNAAGWCTEMWDCEKPGAS